MCGIIGSTGNFSERAVKEALCAIEHRGRDEVVQWRNKQETIRFGMTRLAIKDLTKHLYPMHYKEYTLIYNGEIYNSDQLKKQYLKEYTSTTTSDAEIILPLYHLLGAKCFELLEGMFALAILDSRRQEIILARDKAGQKPLYYFHQGKNLFFASELKALLRTQSIPRNLNVPALSQYLQQGYVFFPNTLVKNIFKLGNAHYLRYSLKEHTLNIKRYWQPIIETHHPIKTKNELDQLLNNSVKRCLMGDVPFGCFLSGGVDSSLIAHYAALHSTKPLKTYSISFPGFVKNDESFFSNKVASWIGADHTNISFVGNEAQTITENIGTIIDEPISDPACLPTYLLAKEARKSVKFVLTGEGADEIFGGYHRYWKELLASTIRLYADPLIPTLKNTFPHRSFNRLTTSLSEHYNTQGIWNYSELSQLINYPLKTLTSPAILQNMEDDDPLSAMQLTDLQGYLPDQLCMKVDKMTMANNLEARAPYLDSHVINFGLGLSDAQKIMFFQGKYLLKKVAQTYFPAYFVWRPKHGFTLPLAQLLRTNLVCSLENAKDSIMEAPKMWNGKYFTQLYNEHLEGASNHADQLWSIIVLTQWIHAYDVKI